MFMLRTGYSNMSKKKDEEQQMNKVKIYDTPWLQEAGLFYVCSNVTSILEAHNIGVHFILRVHQKKKRNECITVCETS